MVVSLRSTIRCEQMKRLFDVMVALAAIMLMLPVLTVAATVIRIGSRGSIIFVQKRVGKNGRTFKMYKFRTMVPDAEHTGTGLFSFHDDPRITKEGRVLRKYSIDELPQLFNVLKGDMSIVGPRPPVVGELGEYGALSDRTKVRFTVAPGMTGLAQIAGRNDLTWEEKITRDLEYVNRYSRMGILEDCRIVWHTIWVVVKAKSTIEPKRANA